MISLSRRSAEPELMDGAGLQDQALHARVLADLASVNRTTRAHRPVLRWLADCWSRLPAAQPVSVLDVGSGQGDLLRAVHALAQRSARPVRLHGIDLAPHSTLAARAATPAAMGIAFSTTDLFDWRADWVPDYIVSSQMAHHLSDPQLLAFLGWLETQARRGWLVADLQRHWLPYLGFRWLARLAGWHRVVRLDGTLSIARAFTVADWERLLRQAGIGARVRRHVPFRLSVERDEVPPLPSLAAAGADAAASGSASAPRATPPAHRP